MAKEANKKQDAITLTDLGDAARVRVMMAWGNVLRMLSDRGYDVSHVAKRVGPTTKWSKSRAHIRVSREDGSSVNVIFITDPFNVAMLREVLSLMRLTKQKHCILVMQDTPKSKAKTELASVKDIKMEVFKFTFFGDPLIDSELVPRQRVLSEEEAAEVRAKFDKNKKLFPGLTRNDSIYRYFDPKPGSIVLSYRNKGLEGIVRYYRVAQ